MRRTEFFAEVAGGPEAGHAVWAHAEDGVRLRVGLWPGGTRGTVLLFPGRAEFIEKYGRTAAEFARRGYAMAAIDWRGQGLSDRLLRHEPTRGFVARFSDYGLDARAMVATARAAGLPEPFHMVAHSMGGAIGLGVLYQDLPLRSALFTGPMWALSMTPALRPLAWSFTFGARWMGLGQAKVPGTAQEAYVLQAAFEDNVLTSDADQFEYLRRQIAAHPRLGLGGPSLHWLSEALLETRRLARLPAPALPALTYMGANERVVDPRPIRARMASWPNGRLEIVEGAEHEVMMETPAIRARVFDGAVAFFDSLR